MEVANDGYVAACFEQTLLNFRNGGGGFRDIDCPAHDFRAGFCEFQSLFQCCGDIGGVRVGHGLDDDGSAAADADVSDIYSVSFAARMTRAGGVMAGDLVWR